jgi:tetratricopeptide (TPR) repeat protein
VSVTAEALWEALQGRTPDSETGLISTELAALSPYSVWTLATQAGIRITGDGNIIGNNNRSIVVKGEGASALAAALRESLERNRTLHQLRPPVADFIGREWEIADLTGALRDEGRTAISGVVGMGGIGKTELALEVARQLCGHYPDAQLFVELRGTDEFPRDPSDVLASCIRAFLGPEMQLPAEVQELAPIYRSLLNGKRALIVLDNAADGAQVRPLLPPEGCGLLITSRSAIALPGMKQRLQLGQLSPPEAQNLLMSLAPRLTPCTADEIAGLCGYLPLALRAAGSLLDVTVDLSPSDYAGQLTDEHTRLNRLGTEGVEINIVASFNLSYAKLSTEAQRVLDRLSVFPASFDAKADEIICADSGHAYLSDLVRHSLVQYEKSPARYRMHDLIRSFAHAHLSATDRAVAQKCHAAYYKDLLDEADNLYLRCGAQLLDGLKLFDDEWANIISGQRWAKSWATVDDEAASLCSAYPRAGANVLNLRRHPREQVEWMEPALEAAQRLGDLRAQTILLTNLGQALHLLGETRRAIPLYEQSLKAAREMRQRRSEGINLGNLGNAYKNLGEIRRGIEFLEQALAIFRELGEHRTVGIALSNLGQSYKNLGENQRASEYYEEALVIAREIGDREGEGTELSHLGTIHCLSGEARRAIGLYEEALNIAREIGDRRGEGAALGGLGKAYAELGEASVALNFYEQNLIIVREIGDSRAEGGVLWEKALLLHGVGDSAGAIFQAQAALLIFERTEHPDAAKIQDRLAKW